MATEKHRKFEMASAQLETAVMLLVTGKDRYSVITLAGAADGILHQLVVKAGKEPFVDYARRVHEVVAGYTPPRNKFMSFMNKNFGINTLKHMDAGDSEIVEMDVEKSAMRAVIKAMANYQKLVDKDPPFIQAFLAWSWVNTSKEEREKLMRGFEKLPEKLKI